MVMTSVVWFYDFHPKFISPPLSKSLFGHFSLTPPPSQAGQEVNQKQQKKKTVGLKSCYKDG